MRKWELTIVAGMLAALLALTGVVSAGLAVDPAGDRRGCPVMRDVPFYQVRPDGVAPTDTDRHIPSRAAMRDPCAIRLLR